MPEQEISNILQFLDTFGSLGLLGTMVWLFMTGRVLPRSVVDEMLTSCKDQMKVLRDEISDRIERIAIK